MNKVILTGRLVKDIELTEDKKGEWCCTRFSLAVNDGRNAKGEQLTQFCNCVAWNERAELLQKYVAKGDMVTVEGRLTQNNYKDKEGIERYTFEVTVANIELLPNSRAAASEEDEEDEEEPIRKKAPSKYAKYHK